VAADLLLTYSMNNSGFFGTFLALCAAVLLASCTAGSSHSSPAAEQPKQASASGVQGTGETETHVEMRNVNIHLDPELILRVHDLSGKFLPTKKGSPPAFDDNLSYLVAIDSAEVSVSTASMSHALNTYAFNERDSPLKNVKLEIQGNQIKQTGTLNKGPGIPFEMLATMSPTPEGKIRIRPSKLKAAHLPVKGLMKLLGVDMAKLINTRSTKGISVDGDDIIMDPAQILPPPKMRGRITAVRLQGDEIVQTFGTEKRPSTGKSSGGNYMAYRGGVLRFGKLTMNDTDMRLIDADPRDPFDFFPDHYKDQLVAGYSKTTATGGLLVYMPDYNKLSKSASPSGAVSRHTD